MIGCCCGEGNSKIYRSFILRRNNLFYHFLRPGQGQAIRKRMVLPAKLLPAARKSKNISLSNLVIFSTIQILTSPYDENITVNNDLIKSNNEVQRLLYCTHTNEEDILNSIYENAKLNYSAIGNDKFDTDRVKVVLRKTRPLSKFSMEIFRATVKAIILHPNAVVDILLKNNQTIEGEKYDC